MSNFSKPKPTDIGQFIEELGAGVVEEKLAHIITQVAGAVMQHNKQGEVSLTLKFDPAGSASDQLSVKHTIKYKQPKKRGELVETDLQETIMYVNDGNNPTQFPENQGDMFRNATTQDTVTDAD